MISVRMSVKQITLAVEICSVLFLTLIVAKELLHAYVLLVLLSQALTFVSQVGTFICKNVKTLGMFLFLVEASSECRSDFECDDPDLCYEGSCQNACRFEACNHNEECVTRNHQSICQCLPGFFENEHGQCYKGITRYNIM